MPNANQEQLKLIDLLGGVYHEILPMEQELALRVGGEDFRPRVDYFHDALRALTDDTLPPDQRQRRLAIEWLSYDAIAIRYLQSKPLAPLNPRHSHLSPERALMKHKKKAILSPRTPNREDKAILSALYLRYGVMFTALFKPFADRDYKDRVEEMDEQAQEMSDLLNAVEGLGQGQETASGVENAAAHTHNGEMQKLIATLVKKGNYKDPGKLKKAMAAIKASIENKDREIAGVESAHMSYATSQLGLCEDGRDIVQQLAAQGLSMAGRFTDVAIADRGADKGRGR